MVENLQIIMINKTTPQPSLFSSLTDQLNPRHPLYLLANKIDWRRFEEAFSPLYCAVNGRPAKPIRLMCGLLILKHVRNLSDESVVEQWSENAYYQYFCGMLEFTPSYPCNASELVHFRKRVGENGMELILSESIRVNQEDDGPDHHCTAFIDSTVQEKNVTYPTDAKLHKKIVRKVLSVVKSLGLPLRQSYTFVLKKIYRDQRFRNHPKNRGKALKADKRLRTIAGRLVRELRRNLKENHGYDSLLDLFERVLSQKRNSPGKIYSLHEPEVQCISKGKNIRNTSSATRFQSSAQLPVSYWVPSLSGMNMTGIPLKNPSGRWNALPERRSGSWPGTGGTEERKRWAAPGY